LEYSSAAGAGLESRRPTKLGFVTTSVYQLGNEWNQARERLGLLEDTFDVGTIRHLGDLGGSEGWHCLEVGEGGGSIAAWLCRRVGTTGRVLATDLDTRFLDDLEFPHLEVRRHDILAEDLPQAAFELVHTRALLCHLPQREQALSRMVAAVRPRGWILVEEPDLCQPRHGARFGNRRG
jgi:SAM-dependent methyltransferase